MWMLLPLITVALQPLQPAIETSSPRAAQVRLAETLAEADAVHAIVPRRANAKAKAIELAVDRDGTAYRVVVAIGARGEVTGITIDERGVARGEIGSLSWLSGAVENATAIVRMVVDEDDAVTLTTDTGEAFMIIPGRGSGGGNAAVEARWAAAWDSTDA